MSAAWSPGSRDGRPVDVVGRRGTYHAGNPAVAEFMIGAWEMFEVNHVFTVQTCRCRTEPARRTPAISGQVERLIEGSSLGTPDAVAVRAAAPPGLVAYVAHRIEEGLTPEEEVEAFRSGAT